MKVNKDKWKMIKLGDLNEFVGEAVNTLKTPDDFYEMYSVPSFAENYPECIVGGDIGSTKQRVQEDDVLICKINPRINRVWIVEKHTNYPLIASSEWIVVRNKNAYSSYLAWYFRSIVFKRMMVSQVTGIGGSLTRAQPKQVKTYPVPVPPLETQKQIAAILDKASQLIDLRKQQLAKMDLLIKSKFIAMFGDPVTNPMGWEKLCIGNRCDIVTGNTPPRADVDNYGEFIEWIKSDNINTPYAKLTMAEEYLSESGLKKARYVDAGSILMTCIAGSINCIGNIAIADRTVSFNQQINAIVPKGDRTEFLYWLLVISKAYIQSMVNKSMKGILSKSKLSEQRYIFPPIDLQNQFAAFVDKVEQQKAVMQASLEKLEINYKSLMQQYFG